jgi:hypothetical protein
LTVAAVPNIESDLSTSALIEVRRSDVHGLGVFAAQRIAKGTRIIEYVGERVSHDEADRRYEEKDANDSHTFLFIVDSKTVIDAGTDGNDARFFNHSCDPNCESTVEKKRVYIEAIRDIEAGTELTYDYQIYREEGDPDNIDEVFACRCGFPNCRGTMLWPPEPKKPRKKAKKKAVARTVAKTGGKTGTKAKGGGVSAKSKGGAKTVAKSSGAKSEGRAKGKASAGAKSKGKGKGKSGADAKSQGKGKGKGKGKSGAGARATGKSGAAKKGKRGGRRG